MAHKCNECGDVIDTDNGRYGHFRFTEGDGHGPKGEVPDDYKELFTETGGDGSSGSEPEGTGEGNGSAGGSDDGSGDSGSEESSPSPDATGSSGGDSATDSGSRSLADRIVTALDTDLRELFGGGS